MLKDIEADKVRERDGEKLNGTKEGRKAIKLYR